MKNFRLNSRGFSLVEMALVLLVVGIVIGIGAGMIGPLTTMSKTRESREVVEADITSITGWAASNNRLPDAVTNPLPPTNSTTYFTNALKSTNDSWGSAVYYLYSCALGGDSSAPYGTFCTTASTFSKDTICGRKTTPLQIRTSPTTTISNVAFVVMSDMSDGVLTTIDGTINTIIGTTITSNTYIDLPITRSGAVTPRAGQTLATITLDPNVSDIVRWVTLDELRTKVGCQGAQLKIVNNELPYGYKGTPYSVQVYADGGSPFTSSGKYKWCIKGTLPPSISNPTSGCASTTDCSTLGTEGEWLQADSLTIPSSPISPTAEGSYNFKVLVRDNNDNSNTTSVDNCSEKSFVLTVNP